MIIKHLKSKSCESLITVNVLHTSDDVLTSVAPIIRSVIGNTLYRLFISISVSDLYTCQIASRSDIVA